MGPSCWTCPLRSGSHSSRKVTVRGPSPRAPQNCPLQRGCLLHYTVSGVTDTTDTIINLVLSIPSHSSKNWMLTPRSRHFLIDPKSSDKDFFKSYGSGTIATDIMSLVWLVLVTKDLKPVPSTSHTVKTKADTTTSPSGAWGHTRVFGSLCPLQRCITDFMNHCSLDYSETFLTSIRAKEVTKMLHI